jgi:predicted LPLAT superfamily acyltransferase
MKTFVWLALHLGRGIARLLRTLACLYFVLLSPRSNRASRDYLARVLGRKPTVLDIFRHYLTFAACVLDRIYLLNDRLDLFDIRIHGEKAVADIMKENKGCLLLGAHIGSFEVLRSIGRTQPGLGVSMVMYEDNARKVNAALNAINPALNMDIIGLGKSCSLLAVEERLQQGNFVGVLADRSLDLEKQSTVEFLGAKASFPEGPFRMAALLKRPAVLMVSLYRGGNVYDVYFETLENAEGELSVLEQYAQRLEHYCRMAPYNWFNFYDFWKKTA